MSKRSTSPSGEPSKRQRTEDSPPAEAFSTADFAKALEEKRNKAQLHSIEEWARELDGAVRSCSKCELSLIWTGKNVKSLDGKHTFADGEVVCNSASRAQSLERTYAKLASPEFLFSDEYEVAKVDCPCCKLKFMVAIDAGEPIVK